MSHTGHGRHSWSLTNQAQKKRKGKRNPAIVRYTLGLIGALVCFPIFYVYHILDVSHVPSELTVSKKLKQFRNERFGSSKKHHQKSSHPSKTLTLPADIGYSLKGNGDLVLTAFLEPPDTVVENRKPLPLRNTSASRLHSISYPNVYSCSTLMQDFPIDNYPLKDPFLPWIHDYVPSLDGQYIQFIAQNRRRCDTGESEIRTMRFWEPQISLFQSIPIVVTTSETGKTTYRLASSFEEATHNATRFQCRFHYGDTTMTTLSVFPFDYEFVTWRKGKKALFQREGKETELFWLSQLLFSCPVPKYFQSMLTKQNIDKDRPVFYMDLIPIRTPPRRSFLLTPDQTGPHHFAAKKMFNLKVAFGENHVLPTMDDAGRWQNLPICRRSEPISTHSQPVTVPSSTLHQQQKPYRLVACTWTSSSYTRRGDAVRVSDSAKRLREWIHFHLMVGVDHVYIYDNSDLSQGNVSELWDVARSFSSDELTYHVWPCKVCNNNRPAHKNPGERSSQYAAEASCRTRYGPLTEWMTFIDTDEYMIPLKKDHKGEYNWRPVLDDMDKEDISIMKFRSSRGKPRVELTESLEDQSVCVDPVSVKGPNKDKTEPCVGPKDDKTFLQVYNCEFIRPPKPERFARAMKQIYKPSFVLSHFVHYSTVTAHMDQTYTEFKRLYPGREPNMEIHNSRWEKEAPEKFMNELTEGQLVHARSVLPHDTRRRSAECSVGSKYTCMMGFPCDDSVEFVDELHQKNVFKNPDGSFCNCWKNKVVEDILVPNLEKILLQGAT